MRSRVPALTLAFVVAFASAGRAQSDLAAIRATKELPPLRIDEPTVIDGHLDEPAWARAQVGRDFYQQDPDEGALTSEPSSCSLSNTRFSPGCSR